MKNRSGFTLIELMVVICVIGILGTITVLSMSGLKSRHGYSGTLRDVLLMLRQARMTAIEENEAVVVEVDTGNGTYEAFVDDGAGSAVGTDGEPINANNIRWDPGERFVMKGSVPDGVFITAADFSGFADFSYDNRGFPISVAGVLTDGTITLTDDVGGSQQINLFRSGHSAIQVP